MNNPNPTNQMENTMEFVLRIRCTGAAFIDENNYEDQTANEMARAQEVNRIIAAIDDERIAIASVARLRHNLRDHNGQTVGHYEFVEEVAA